MIRLPHLSRRRYESDLDAELRDHIDRLAAAYRVDTGSEEPTRRARLTFGGLAQAKELCREAYWWSSFDQPLKTLGRAARALRRHRGFSTTVVMMVALGVGANAAMYSIVRSVLVRSRPYNTSERLVWLWSADRKNDVTQWVSYPDFLDWQARSHTVEQFVGWGGLEPTLTGVGEPERVETITYVGDLFGALGVAPSIGSVPDTSGPEQPVVISDQLWRRSFASDPHVIGDRVSLSGQPVTIAAVMPSGFAFPPHRTQFHFPPAASPVDVWLPLKRFNPALAQRRDARLIEVLALLRPRATVASAQAEFDVIASNVSAEYPNTNTGVGVRVVSAAQQVTGGRSRQLLLLFAAVVCVLTIACLNIVNLLLVRTIRRRSEIAVMAALGATRLHIACGFLTEILLLWSVGGLLGGLVAKWILESIHDVMPGSLPGIVAPTVDWNVWMFLALVSLVTALAVAVVPISEASHINVTRSLQEETPVASSGSHVKRWRRTLIVVEMALAMILTVEAGLFLRSVSRLTRNVEGFDPRNVLTFDLSWPSPEYSAPAAERAFERVRDELLTRPGIVAASTGLQIPDRGQPPLDNVLPFVEAEGRPIPVSERRRTSIVTIQEGFFRALAIPIIAGRDVSVRDQAGTTPVVIVNHSLARTYFPDRDPIGRHLVLDAWTFGRRVATIVGVVGDVTHLDAGIEALPLVYLPIAQYPRNTSYLVVKTDGPSEGFVPVVRAAVRAVGKDIPIHDLQALDQRIGFSIASERLHATLLTTFASLAIILASVGLFGMISYTVAERSRELAIRFAMGADATRIVKLVMGEGLLLTVVGVGIGTAGALALTRVVRGFLFGVAPTDPLIFISVAALLGLIAVLTCWFPARRATKVSGKRPI